MPFNTESVTVTALASTALRPYGVGIRSRQWDMAQPPNAPPSNLLTTADLRSVLGIYENDDFTDEMLNDLQVSAEEILEDILNAPLRAKVVTEKYPDLANRLQLVVRPFAEAGIGTFAAPAGTGKPTIEAITPDGIATVNPDAYEVDATSDTPALTFDDTPSLELSDEVANPVTVRYLYTPLAPNRVKRALEITVRELFLSRNAGMPYRARSLRASVKGMLGSLVPIPVSGYRV